MDTGLGDFAAADVLVEGATISAIGPDLRDAVADGGGIVVPAEGTIVMPGLQDTHRHCWQTQFRRLISGCDLAGYEAVTHRSLGPHYRPEDMYAGTLLGALGALDAGVTSLLDFSHNSRSAAHADAAVDALVDAGIRAAYTSAPALSGEWDEQWPGDLNRLRDERFASDDQLISLRAGLFGADEIAGPASRSAHERWRWPESWASPWPPTRCSAPARQTTSSVWGRPACSGPTSC